MAARPARQTVDLSGYPDVVIIYLGMRVNTARGVSTLLQTGRRIKLAVAAQPDGLLRHEDLAYGLFPPHLGMRQYWRGLESMERWGRPRHHPPQWRHML